jgi:hypothetical protein
LKSRACLSSEHVYQKRRESGFLFIARLGDIPARMCRLARSRVCTECRRIDYDRLELAKQSLSSMTSRCDRQLCGYLATW